MAKRGTSKTERTNVEYPLWRKKIDYSIFARCGHSHVLTGNMLTFAILFENIRNDLDTVKYGRIYR